MNLSFSTLKAQLAADKKKAGILGVLFVVLLVVIGRLFVSDAPTQEAIAIVPSAPVAKTPSDQNLIRPSTQTMSSNPAVALASPGVTSAAVSRPRLTSHKTVVVDGMPREGVRDPFTTKTWDRFPLNSTPDDPSAVESKKQRKKPGILEQLRKQFAEIQQVRKEETEKFGMAIDTLQLQSTMTGTRRSAYISGRLVHEGESIDGFTVVRIGDREVTLSKGGARGTLRMP